MSIPHFTLMNRDCFESFLNCLIYLMVEEGTLPWATPCLGPSRFF